jgi:uncharacterized protein YaiI (UPF0178 family)
MRILVDADACPGRNIIEETAKKYKLEVIMYCDLNHILRSDYCTIKYMDSGFQSVDMAIANEAKEKDIVIESYSIYRYEYSIAGLYISAYMVVF